MIIFLPKKAKPSVVQFLSDQDAWAASRNLTKKTPICWSASFEVNIFTGSFLFCPKVFLVIYIYIDKFFVGKRFLKFVHCLFMLDK
jgi:hypothetical protein